MGDRFIIIVTLHCPDWPDGVKTWGEHLWSIVGPFRSERRATRHLREHFFETRRGGGWSVHPRGDEAYFEAKIVRAGSRSGCPATERRLGPKDFFDPTPLW